jgi:hypothetical protein
MLLASKRSIPDLCFLLSYCRTFLLSPGAEDTGIIGQKYKPLLYQHKTPKFDWKAPATVLKFPSAQVRICQQTVPESVRSFIVFSHGLSAVFVKNQSRPATPAIPTLTSQLPKSPDHPAEALPPWQSCLKNSF